MANRTAGAVAFVLKGYPRLSESFIAQEILALERRGLDIRIVSLRRPTERKRHPVHAAIRASVLYLPEYLYREPLRVLGAWWRQRRNPRYPAARRQWLKDWRRDPSPNRGRRFAQALVLADELSPEIGHLHAHFLHTPASVTRYAALLTGLAWSGSAHAKDVWTTPDWELREKLADCRWLATCSAAALARLATLAPEANRRPTVTLSYHGLDLDRFAPGRPPPAARDGSDPGEPVRLLTVARAVPKKGYEDLLTALAQLPPTVHWRLTQVGGGPRLKRLRRLADRLGLAARIDWRGNGTQDEVLGHYRQADLFVLASRIAPDGDRDGLPNVLLEAQSQGLACLATAVSAIPELIEPEVTGVLVPAGQPAALAQAMARLLAQPALRARLGLAGQARVVERFDQARLIGELAARFGLPPPVARRDRVSA
ncbi:MAG: glycosyltransferase family 4 protein [Alphaproteobacteria bacterium]|nr:glycosyltransferase family 4 protein [Alphaproteobacteria bacterium]